MRAVAPVLALLPLAAGYQLPGGRLCGCACERRGAPALVAPRAALQMQQAPIPGEQAVINSEETYNVMMRALLETNNTIAAEVSTFYHMVDYAFLQKLDLALETADGEEKERLVEVKSAVNAEMKTRMETAMTTLKDILTSPSPVIMEGKIAGLARQGKIDDALMNMLEANLQQAEQAGEQGQGAVQVLSKLKGRVRDELDTKHEPAIQLLRRLFRMESRPARMSLLKEKLTPKMASKVVLVNAGDGTEDKKDTKPDVDPRDLAKAISDLKLRFGNVDENYDTGFVARMDEVAAEAESVALDLAGGKELSSQEQQDLMWESQTVSVWDLGQVEEQAREQGGYAMWEKEAQDMFARDAEQRKQGLLRDGLGGE